MKRNIRQQQQKSQSRRRQVWNCIVDKLSMKPKLGQINITYGNHDAKIEPVDLSKAIEWRSANPENIGNQKHKFMDGDSRQKLTKKAWEHADKE